MRACGSVRLDFEARLESSNDLAASVNSLAAAWPLGNSPKPPACQQRNALASSSTSGASARAVTTSTRFRGVINKILDPARAWINGRSLGCRCTLRAGRPPSSALLSTRWTSAPGRIGERAGDHQAGKASARSRGRPIGVPLAPTRGAAANRRYGASTLRHSSKTPSG